MNKRYNDKRKDSMYLMKRQNDIMNKGYNDKRKDRMNLNNIII